MVNLQNKYAQNDYILLKYFICLNQNEAKKILKCSKSSTSQVRSPTKVFERTRQGREGGIGEENFLRLLSPSVQTVQEKASLWRNTVAPTA